MIQLTYSCQCTQNSISNLCNKHDKNTAEILQRDKDSLSKLAILVHGAVFRHETSNYVLNITCFISISNVSTLPACRETSEIVLPICSYVCTKEIMQHKMDFQEICSCGVVIKCVTTFPFLFKSNSNSKHFT
jgi:hypothetical protein